MLSLAPLDPTFNGGNAVTTVSGFAPADGGLASATAVAVVAGGKIVVAGTINQSSNTNSSALPELAVRRYDADGTLDINFGTDGESDLAPPAGAFNDLMSSSTVLIQPDGKIVLSGREINQIPGKGPAGAPYNENVATVVARLNADGSPDATFGTNGLTVISTDAPSLTRLALQADGKILVGGIATPSGTSNFGFAITRLDNDGAPDTTFNGGSLLTLNTDIYELVPNSDSDLPALAVSAAGKIMMAGTFAGNRFFAYGPGYEVIELNSDGTADTDFGTGGVSRGPSLEVQARIAAAFQPDGKIIFAGNQLIRLNADGTLDTGFRHSSLGDTTLEMPGGAAIMVQADGKIVVGMGSLSSGSFVVGRFTAAGVPDGSFGPGGRVTFPSPVPASIRPSSGGSYIEGLALTASGHVVAVGAGSYVQSGDSTGSTGTTLGSTGVVARLRTSLPVAGDYDGDGRTDVAAQLASLAQFAVRQSTGGDVIQVFGAIGASQTIPAPGDYDGDGRTDVAAYLPAYGLFAYRPSAGGNDVVVPFGTAGLGAGQTIFAPGDYDGDGISDLAAYLPASGSFAVRPSSGQPEYLAQFGVAGGGASVPAPGDYDGDGRTDLAAYLPGLGIMAYRPSAGESDVLDLFGPAGAGQSIPAPGDYDGDGLTDVALYLPALGSFAVQRSTLRRSTYPTRSFIAQFGAAGTNRSLPAPGDYDGDGQTDLAVYISDQALFAYHPSAGGADVLQSFGAAGIGQTVPASSIPYAQPAGNTGTTRANRFAAQAIPTPAPSIPLPDDLIDALTHATTAAKRKNPPFAG